MASGSVRSGTDGVVNFACLWLRLLIAPGLLSIYPNWQVLGHSWYPGRSRFRYPPDMMNSRIGGKPEFIVVLGELVLVKADR